MVFLRILVCGVAFLAPHLSHADLKFNQPQNLTSTADTPLDLEELRYRLDNLEKHLQDDNLELLIGQTNYDIDLNGRLVLACGQTDELDDIFRKHGHRLHQLAAHEIDVFKNCVRGVFALSDKSLPFEGYGYLKRFDDRYIERVARMAYRCGYRTEVTLANIALATWLLPASDVQESYRFRCYGDRHSWAHGLPEGNFLAGADIVVDSLGPFSVFQDWELAQRYVAYRKIVLANRQRMICEEAFGMPLATDFSYDEKVALLRDADCI